MSTSLLDELKRQRDAILVQLTNNANERLDLSSKLSIIGTVIADISRDAHALQVYGNLAVSSPSAIVVDLTVQIQS